MCGPTQDNLTVCEVGIEIFFSLILLLLDLPAARTGGREVGEMCDSDAKTTQRCFEDAINVGFDA